MSDISTFFRNVIKKPPMIFPWLALFHLAMLVYAVYNCSTEPFPSIQWLPALWMLCYTVAWLFICDMKKWAALVYLGLTVLNLVLFFSLKSLTDKDLYTSSMYFIDVLFCFFILFYYKSFE